MTTSTTRFTRAVASIVGVFGIVIAVGTARPVANKRDAVSLRCSDPRLARLADQGLARSATLRSLVEELERAHVIVYVQTSSRLATGVGGRTRFIGAGDGWRFIQIDLDDRRPKVDILSMLGHELQHAVEIARAPEVTDDFTVAALYGRIGVNRDSGRAAMNLASFETQAAIDVERRVFSELFAGQW